MLHKRAKPILTLTLRPPIRPYLRPPHMVSRFEQKNFITTRNVVTTKPTQANLLNVVNTQTFSELIHELLNLLYLLNILYILGSVHRCSCGRNPRTKIDFALFPGGGA